jgi:hypothetical protein
MSLLVSASPNLKRSVIQRSASEASIGLAMKSVSRGLVSLPKKLTGSLTDAVLHKESFNARLKAEGDELSTNLYISNLPKDVNENVRHPQPPSFHETMLTYMQMLIHIFDPFHIVSSKILRDSMGNSRGVGFAR